MSVERLKLPGWSIQVRGSFGNYTWIVVKNHTIVAHGRTLTRKKAWQVAEAFVAERSERA